MLASFWDACARLGGCYQCIVTCKHEKEHYATKKGFIQCKYRNDNFRLQRINHIFVANIKTNGLFYTSKRELARFYLE